VRATATITKHRRTSGFPDAIVAVVTTITPDVNVDHRDVAQDRDNGDHLGADADDHGDEQDERRADGPGGGSGQIAGAGRLPCGVDRVASEVPAPVAPRAVRHLAAAAFASLGALRRGVGRAGSI
jgi:hypothetical protein